MLILGIMSRTVATHPQHRRQDGFTLIEVMVCLLLLVVSGAGGLAMVMAQIRSISFAGSAQIATRLGQQALDQIMVEPFASIGSGNSACKASEPTLYATGDSDSSLTSSGNKLSYARSCLVSALPNGMKVMRVSVSWLEGFGATQDGSARTRTITLGAQRAP